MSDPTVLAALIKAIELVVHALTALLALLNAFPQ